jgi:Cu(I)/Ag(I) efflux system membrane fusion protein
MIMGIQRPAAVLVVLLASMMALVGSCTREPAAREPAEDAKAVSQEWICECCPDVLSSEPGECPDCGMNLTARSHVGAIPHSDEAGEAWTCPMHPEVISETPGRCPDCNMHLVPSEPQAQEPKGEDPEEWTCGMHPAIRSQEPGKCPICNMDLVPVEHHEGDAVTMNPQAIEAIGLELDEVRYLPLVREITTVGKVAYDERRVRHVASRIPGRIEHLFASHVGIEVKAGEPLLSIYSPELVTALTEYRVALEARDGSTSRAVHEGGFGALAQSARSRLALWGIDDREIERLTASASGESHRVPVRSPISGTVIAKDAFEGRYVREGEDLFIIADLSSVWLTADLYEDDLAYVEVGDEVTAALKAYPDRVFKGTVAFIDPYLSEHTRTAGIRVDVANAGGGLKPGMFLEARLAVPLDRDRVESWMCPMHPHISEPVPGECPECGMFLERVDAGHVLAVPKPAVVYAGEVPTVYVERGTGTYEPRRVVLGDAASLGRGGGRYFPVLEGLSAGETVVASAGFLVHSQARLTGRAASAYGGALDVDTPGHSH